MSDLLLKRSLGCWLLLFCREAWAESRSEDNSRRHSMSRGRGADAKGGGSCSYKKRARIVQVWVHFSSGAYRAAGGLDVGVKEERNQGFLPHV